MAAIAAAVPPLGPVVARALPDDPPVELLVQPLSDGVLQLTQAAATDACSIDSQYRVQRVVGVAHQPVLADESDADGGLLIDGPETLLALAKG